jgi:hypothetical protein
MKRYPTLLIVIGSFFLAGATAPTNPIRADWSFWNMLTPAGRDRLIQVPVLIRDNCEGILRGASFTGGRYDGLTDTIELCGVNIPEEADRLRHEALHALDWTYGFRITDKNGFDKSIPPALYNEAERQYRCNAQGGCHGWFRAGELWAMVPIVVSWDFGTLPPWVAHFYEPWFSIH